METTLTEKKKEEIREVLKKHWITPHEIAGNYALVIFIGKLLILMKQIVRIMGK